MPKNELFLLKNRKNCRKNLLQKVENSNHP